MSSGFNPRHKKIPIRYRVSTRGIKKHPYVLGFQPEAANKSPYVLGFQPEAANKSPFQIQPIFFWFDGFVIKGIQE